MWIVKDGIISLTTVDGELYYPLGNEIYSNLSCDNFIYKGNNYAGIKNVTNLRFSKIGLNFKIVIEMKSNNIKFEMVAVKGEKNIKVPSVNGKYLGYVLVDNVWHYLSKDFEIVQELLNKHSINVDEDINYVQYMTLLREEEFKVINLEDRVVSAVDEIKVNETLNVDDNNLKANLFPYQKSGKNWLAFMVNNKCGSILGDEMGLGKTLQIIALMGKLKDEGHKHFLVVAPVSLLINWEREIQKFYPSLKTIIHHGSKRTGNYRELMNYDVVIMSYSNVQTDMSILNMVKWDLMVLDEAQNIKNPYAKRTKSVKNIKKDVGIAVTGTPFENHMTDIWSIVDFVMPGYLGKIREFENKFTDTNESAEDVESYLSPIMIRRLVKNVAKDLPERIDIPQPIVMTESEARYYEDERENIGKANLKSLALEKIQRLRMFCTHPSVYNKDLSNKDPIAISNKYARLCELLDEIILNKEKVIIFTSFNRMFTIIEDDISNRYDVKVFGINGSTIPTDRQNIVDLFSNEKGAAVLVLNPRAAGTGLNITSANHVIHYNLEWNPALEDQASARAYRRGQIKTVFVYRLYYTDTIEEVINDRIKRKREIFERAVVGNEGDLSDKDDLIRALTISPFGG